MAGQRYALGDLPRGGRWKKEFSLVRAPQETGIGGRFDPWGLRDITFKDKTRDLLFHSSFFPRDGDAAQWSSGAVIFLGWVKEQNRRVWVDDAKIWTYQYTLFRTIFPLAGGEEDT
jgi:hypothetical protein